MALKLETNLSARFISDGPLDYNQALSLAALNEHTEEITERLQATFRLLITEMLDIKRENNKGETHAGPKPADLSSNDRTDSGTLVREDTEH